MYVRHWYPVRVVQLPNAGYVVFCSSASIEWPRLERILQWPQGLLTAPPAQSPAIEHNPATGHSPAQTPAIELTPSLPNPLQLSIALPWPL